MVKSFLVSMFAILLFALGATASWFYVHMELGKQADSEPANLTLKSNDTQVDPVPPLERLGPTGPLPAVVRGPGLEPEEIFRLTTATAAKQEQLRQYEDRLREHRLRIKAGDADTQAAQREVLGALEQARNLMNATEKLFDQVSGAIEGLKEQTAAVAKKMEELRELENDVGANAISNIKTFAEYMQSMPADAAADAVIEMVNDGKMDFAIQLLRKMEPRNVSKILAEIEDPQLISEMASRYGEAPLLR